MTAILNCANNIILNCENNISMAMYPRRGYPDLRSRNLNSRVPHDEDFRGSKIRKSAQMV